MKKILLTLAAALLLSATQSAAKAPVTINDYSATKVNVLNGMHSPVKIEKQAKKEGIKRGPTADGYDINFCGAIDNWYYAAQKNKCTYKCYIYIDPEIATSLAGNQITDITFSVYLAKASDTRAGKVFVSEDIDGDPITSEDVTVINAYTSSETKNQTQTLSDPYTIKENTGFYIGYIVEQVKCSTLTQSIDYPIGVGDANVNRFAGYVEVYDSEGNPITFIDMNQDVGLNLYLTAATKGDKRSVENIFSVKGGFLDTFTMPVLSNGKDLDVTVILENIGSNELTSLNYTAQVINAEGTVSEETNTVGINIGGGESKATKIKIPTLADGKGLIYVTINSVNGVKCDREVLLPYLLINNDGYDRKFVVEEGTGTWCGWCPRGIVGFEYMDKTYPDKFIGIAAHDGDNMQCDSYEPLFEYYVDGFPGCVINRDPYFIDDPNADELEYMLGIWDTQAGPAKIDIKGINIEDNAIKVTTSTEFAYDDPGSQVCVATVILENNIPDIQTNYYAGGEYGECGGWGSYPNSQPWLYKHVARDIDDFLGIEDSLPVDIKQGQAYTTTSSASLEHVTDINNTSIIVMLIDNWSGTMLNAAKISAADYDKLSGIGDIITAPDSDNVEYYNLQGIRMQRGDMPAGMYIKRQGTTTTKSIIR